MQLIEMPSLSLLIAILITGLAVIFTFLHYARANAGRVPHFRELPAVKLLFGRLAQIAESGRAIHVATGGSELGAISPTAETIAALLIAERVAALTTRRGGTVAVTTGDIAAQVAARGAVRQAYSSTGFATDYRSDAIQMVAQQVPEAYAAGVAARYQAETFDTSMLVGNYGSEALLATEEGAVRGVPQIAAATTLTGLPVMFLSTDATLIGEELYAAPTYLSSVTNGGARLLTQDGLRRAVIVMLLLGLLYQIVRTIFGLGLPAF